MERGKRAKGIRLIHLQKRKGEECEAIKGKGTANAKAPWDTGGQKLGLIHVGFDCGGGNHKSETQIILF